ncbi:hypothetical protein FRB96_006592 [Tulasnella sp. 330]|nr:hypothetical protein FRB96_006592 [Tulasnella sp. 330]KAG8889724.1 hypothetical protein FRB98_003016 [Tulasnella sp. 332]
MIRRLPSNKSLSRHASSNTSSSTRTASASYNLSVISQDTNVSRKRKRLPSGNGGNENMDSGVGGLVRNGVRGGGLKRSKSAHVSLNRSGTAMDLDEPSGGEVEIRACGNQRGPRTKSPENIIEEEEEEEGPMDSSDDFYISSALPWQLQKLLKDELLRLYHLAGLENEGDDDDLTKVDIVNAIVLARKRSRSSGHSSPPSTSSRRRTTNDSARSPPSSQDGGNDAGAEDSEDVSENQTHKRARVVRRHANIGLGHPGSVTKLTKSASANFIALDGQAGPSTARRARFASNATLQIQTRTRLTRRGSGQHVSPSSPSGPASSSGDNGKPTTSSPRYTRSTRKGKGKHVELSDADEDGTQESAGTEDDDEARANGADADRTPTSKQSQRQNQHRRTQSTSTTGQAPKRSTSTGARTGLTRSESKGRVFSPKRLRRLPSRMNLQGADETEPSGLQPQSLQDAAGMNHVARSISFRQTLPRRAKPSGSLKEDSSSEDHDVDESDAAAPPVDEEEEDQLAGDSDDDGFDEGVWEDTQEDVDVFTAPRLRPRSRPPRGGKAVATTVAISAPDESDDSELTQLSEEVDEPTQVANEDEEEDSEPLQTIEEDEDADETPKAVRTKARVQVPILATMTRSRSRMDLAKVARPGRRAAKKSSAVEKPELDDEDDENGEDEDEEGESEEVESAADEEGEDEDVTVEQDSVSEEEQAEMEIEPRVLRNGKVVGEVSEPEDNADEEEDEDVAQIDEDADADDIPAEEDDQVLDADDDDDDDAEPEVVEDDDGEAEEDDDDDMDEDFDLADATAKTLVRLRRDDLVRLCETRDLEAEGTKNQLVENLLQWRNQLSTTPSSSALPSSYASTARAPSTARPNNNNADSPVLMRSNRIHVLQPRTPDPDPGGHEIVLIGSKGRNDGKDHGDELELDLESLGLEDREIPADKLTKLEKIGSGGFKDVYIGKFRGRKVAIAEFRGHLGPMDVKELKLLRDFNHPNVVRFLGVSIPENTKETPVMMISELCANGDLFDYVRNVPPPSLRKVLNLMLDVARGIDYLHNIHQPSIIHRDCKSSNILITSKVTAKIADFGLAKVKQSTRSMVKSLVGTVNWQAPELWHAHPKYDHKVDVFSCAMVFWEMLQWHSPSKKYPWEGMNEHAIYEEVGAKKHRPSVAGLRKLWCPEVVELVEAMWAQDPKDRPPIAEVVEELETMIKNL